MQLPAILVLSLLAATPALAAPIIVTLDNQSSQAVLGLDTYPLAADGTIIDDNIGGLTDAAAPGAQGSAELIGERCGPIYLRVVMADRSELTGRTDTCTNRTIVVAD